MNAFNFFYVPVNNEYLSWRLTYLIQNKLTMTSIVNGFIKETTTGLAERWNIIDLVSSN